jgi:hypothetical protein
MVLTKQEKKKIEDTINKLIRDNIISKSDVVEAKVLLVWLYKGKKEALKIDKVAVENLIENGFTTKDGNYLLVDKSHPTLWFLLAILGAKGYVKQVSE